MGRRFAPPVTGLLTCLLASPPAALQNPEAPSIYVSVSRTTLDTRRLVFCPSGGMPDRVFPGPELLAGALRSTDGIVPDPSLQALIGSEIERYGRFRLAASAERADYVLYVEETVGASLESFRPASPDRPYPVYLYRHGRDQPPNRLVFLSAFVTTSDAWPSDSTRIGAPLDRALWQGHATFRHDSPTSPQALIGAFHRNFAGRRAPGITMVHGEHESVGNRGGPSGFCERVQPLPAGGVDLSQGPTAPPAAAPAAARPAPVTVAIVVDTSTSMRAHVAASRTAASTLIDRLDPNDHVMVVSFDSRAYLVSDLSRQPEAAGRGVPELQTVGSTSRLFDTLVATVERLDPVPGRKAIVLFSDGIDVDSVAADAAAARAALETSGVALYVLQLDPTDDTTWVTGGVEASQGAALVAATKARFAEAATYLEDLSTRTGGRLKSTTDGQVSEDVLGIVEALRSQGA